MKLFFRTSLLFSVCLNFILGWQVFTWNNAWTEQFITTAEIENIYRLAGSKLTYSKALEIAKKNYESSYEIIEKDENIKIIVVSGTQLMFRDNNYIGSKANLPKNYLE